MGGLVLLALLWVMGVKGQQRIIYVSESLTWADAQAYCRQHHLDLVTIKTDAENDQIDKDSWLGMYRDNSNTNWKWSKGDEPHTFDNAWNSDDPDWGEDCVYKRPGDNGAWKSSYCSESRKFFCLDDSLFLVSQNKTWEKALVHCRSLSSADHSYDLATLLTEEDHDFVRSQIKDQVWTGLRFLGDHWVWVGGEEVQYEDLPTCPENKRCGTVDKMSSGLYGIGACEEQRLFFCYKKQAV